jgi:hypothetical protein
MRAVTTPRRSALVFAAALSVALLALPAGATNPTGNHTAVKLYAKAAATTSRAPFLQVQSKSFYFLGYRTNGKWNMAWGFPKAPEPYEARVTETDINASSHGRNVWEEDTFALSCPARHTCHTKLTPVRFFLTKSSAYYTELTGPKDTPGCWVNATKTWIKTDFDSYGDPNWYPGTSTKGLTASFIERAHITRLATTFTSIYQFRGDRATVTEIDTVNNRSGLFVHANLTVGAGTGGHAAYSWSQAVSVPAAPVPEPKILRVC